jgi:uncharacterized protein YraI
VRTLQPGSPLRSWIAVALVVALVGGGGAGFGPRTAVAADFAVGQSAVVNTDALNLRAAPGVGASVVAVLLSGMEGVIGDGPVALDGYSWYGFQVGALWGWSAGEFLAPTGGGGAVFPVGATVVVATDALNLRTEPRLGAPVVAVLPSGTTGIVGSAPITADGFGWYGLQVGALWGWSAGEFLSLLDGGGIGVGDAVRVVDGPLNLRTGPGLGNPIAAVMPTATLLQVMGGPVAADGWTWLQVFNFGYGTGWAADAYLAVDPAGFPGEEGGV